MLRRPLLHGNFVDDILLVVAFLILLGVFRYFYFQDRE